MKRPRSGDTRARPRVVSSRKRCVYGLDCEDFGFMSWTARLFFLSLCLSLRSSARGIAMVLRCRHKPATVGVRSSATVQARQASERRRRHQYLTADIPFLFATYNLLWVLSLCFPIAHIETRGVEQVCSLHCEVDERVGASPSTSIQKAIFSLLSWDARSRFFLSPIQFHYESLHRCDRM
jgi:hypothetical protein